MPTRSSNSPGAPIHPFRVGQAYTRKDVFRILGLPDDLKGGNWFTGYTSHGPDWFIFCGVGTGGRTGHDYGNHFSGDRLVWFGKTGTSKDQAAIQRLLNPSGAVYVFFRANDRGPFTFGGLARPLKVFDETPVKVIWDLVEAPGDRLPTQLNDELGGLTSRPVVSHKPCPFCSLSAERIVRESPFGVVIRDGFPISKGHTLVIPKRHIGSFFELTSVERTELLDMLATEKQVLDREFAPEGYNIGINDGQAAGQTVPHLHIHLIPRYQGDRTDPRGGVRWIIPEKADYWTGR